MPKHLNCQIIGVSFLVNKTMHTDYQKKIFRITETLSQSGLEVCYKDLYNRLVEVYYPIHTEASFLKHT